jgi:glucose-6-phosphate isomerase
MPVHLNNTTGELSGKGVIETVRTIGDLAGIFSNEAAHLSLAADTVAYRVQAFEPCPEGTEGAVCLATTFLMPGRVGEEYFMTRGHYHANQDRPELEVTISGEGALFLMDQDRQTRIELMRPGSVHPVPPGTAHRVANIGTEPLVFVSYWASETGHDYASIREHGFSARLLDINGQPTLFPLP